MAFPAKLRSTLDLLRVPFRAFVVPGFFGVVDSIMSLVVLGLLLPLARLLLPGGENASLGRFSFFLERFGTGNPVLLLLALLLLAALIKNGSTYVSKLTLRHYATEIETRLSGILLERYLIFGQQYFDLKRSGLTVNRLRRLPGQVTRAYTVLNRSIVSGVSLALYCTVMTLIWWRLTAVTLAFLGVYYIIFLRLTKRIQLLADKVESVDDKSSSKAQEILTNLRLIKQSRTERKELKSWDELARERRDVRISEWKFLDLVSPLKDVAAILILVLIIVTVSVMIKSSSADILPKSLVFFLVVRRCVGAFSNVLNTPEDWTSVSRNVENFSDLLSSDQKYIVPDGNRPGKTLVDTIEFRNLSFSYARRGKALRDVNCTIPARRHTAILGKTGSGKTTLLRLLKRLYDCPPETIFIDDVDLRELTIESHISRISYAGSEPEFFDDTVRFNVLYGLDGISRDRLEWAARKSEALEFVQNLENGFDELIGVGGTRLSAGERQRLALMRVFLRDPEIILLDEATSALDPETEARVMVELRKFCRDRTLVTITHRMTLLSQDSWIIVLQNGRVSEQGYYMDLVNRNGFLSRMLQNQSGKGNLLFHKKANNSCFSDPSPG